MTDNHICPLGGWRLNVAELETEIVDEPLATVHIRLADELPTDEIGQPEWPDDWSEDEQIAYDVFGSLAGLRIVLNSGKIGPIFLGLADLLERAGPQFIDACRRQAAIDEQRAAEVRMKRKGRKRR